jgi:uncharacterized SAM-binding protein YcdF (DUF218 family)
VGERVVAVFGYSRRRDHGLNSICAARLAEAERLADGARAVILSGWARRPRESESELMRAAWRGPDVPLICDTDARSTADNAAHVALDAQELGADELVVVTSSWHRRRASIFLRAALRGSGIKLSVVGAAGPRPPLTLVREVACFALVPFQLARARRGRRG